MTKEDLAFAEDLMRKVARGQLTVTQALALKVARVETALDANGDGTIDADEIANASAALKTLNKNGDGKLTSDEYGRKVEEASLDSGSLEPPQPTAQGKDSLWRHCGRNVKQERADK